VNCEFLDVSFCCTCAQKGLLNIKMSDKYRWRLTMERNVNSWKTENDQHLREDAHSGFKCDECGEKFQKPLLATVTSNESVQRYYACPQCLTEVRQERKQRSQPSQQNSFTVKEVTKGTAKLQENVKCDHFFGFLKKREKNAPIPEDCLVCEKMIECMVC